jgi:hypothetical protein
MVGIARRVGLRHEPSEGSAIDDRLFDAERVAKTFEIVRPLRESPAFARSVLAAAASAMIEIDDLGDVAERRESRLVEAVVGARPAMQQDQRRLLPHARAVGNETRPLDVDIETNPIDMNVHCSPRLCGTAQ